ncbi:MAG: hypothetical protein AAF266_03665 [Planctomycetota bacterium]
MTRIIALFGLSIVIAMAGRMVPSANADGIAPCCCGVACLCESCACTGNCGDDCACSEGACCNVATSSSCDCESCDCAGTCGGECCCDTGSCCEAGDCCGETCPCDADDKQSADPGVA